MSAGEQAAFVAGVIACGYLVIAGFFLRFWTRVRDTLFLIFALAFVLLALNQALPVLLGLKGEEQAGIYLLRAGGFALIIVAILLKNAPRRAPAPPAHGSVRSSN